MDDDGALDDLLRDIDSALLDDTPSNHSPTHQVKSHVTPIASPIVVRSNPQRTPPAVEIPSRPRIVSERKDRVEIDRPSNRLVRGAPSTDSLDSLDNYLQKLDDIVDDSEDQPRTIKVKTPPRSARGCYPVRIGPQHSDARLCPSLICTACDHHVLQIDEQRWHESVDYMFFRNNVPNMEKLCVNLLPSRQFRAYACQCSWASVDEVTNLSAPDCPFSVRWVCAGHT